MVPIGTLSLEYLKALPAYLQMPLFYVVLFLIYIQYRRAAGLEKALYGRPMHSIIKQLAVSTLFGIMGGLVGSLLLLSLGVALSGSWILYVWLAALGLAMFSSRLMCFAYGGGLVALVSLFTGWPAIDIPSLLGLVAVLHGVESILMLFSGHLGAVPIRVKNPLTGRIVGGFSLQKFWPVPLLALAIMPGVIPPEAGAISMPAWWPLIVPAGLTELHSFWMLPVVAGLGYGEMAVATTPRERARQSAGKLAIYSAVLFMLSVLSVRYRPFLLAGALFAPLGHELLVWTTAQKEMGDEPLHTPSPFGTKVMAVMPDSPAEGQLSAGDVILECGGIPVDSVAALSDALASFPGQPVGVLTDRGAVTLGAGQCEQLRGVIPVPDQSAESYLETRFRSPFDKLKKYMGR